MGTLEGFPNPALWLRRAKPGFAYASELLEAVVTRLPLDASHA